MKKLEYEKFKEHVLSFYESPKELSDEIDHYRTALNINSLFNAVDTMCQYGCFEIYYADILDDFKKVYGDEYDESKYLTKKGEVRFKNNEAYCWTIYKAKVARTIYEMYKKGEL